MHVLIVEDDPHVLDFISKAFREAGHTVSACSDGREGLFAVAADPFDVVVLDRMLPNVDGFTILQTMRAASNQTPVLILSALGEVDDKVGGLRNGGDDYLVKPFAMSELLARVEALARRPAGIVEAARLTAGALEMDLVARRVHRSGKPIDLTPREFRILEYLLRNAGRVVTRSMLLEAVWDYHFDPQTNIVDQHVSRLRQKIDRGNEASLIETLRGIGYIVRRPEQS